MSSTNHRGAVLTLLLALIVPGGATAETGDAVPTPADRTRTIVILGASYAQAWGTPSLPGYGRVLNRGVGGEPTGGMLARFQSDVVSANPDAVLIWGLVNNITQAGPGGIEAAKATARADYEEMLRQARAAGIRVILATEVPWTEPGGFIDTVYGWVASLLGKTSYATRVSADVAEVNDFLRALARRDGLQLLDFGKLFANEDGTRKREYAAEDASHISKAGYEALTAYARRELQ